MVEQSAGCADTPKRAAIGRVCFAGHKMTLTS
jgi:hypothetical protein